MRFTVDVGSDLGLADQIATQVRRAVFEKRLSPGDRLPPAREVATGLEVNMHTVLRAYATLRDEGLIDLRRGRGARVRPDVDSGASALQHQIRALVAEAGRLGIGPERLAQLVREVHG